jgi:YegS/Rv2252/BmrU family lipid kinase
MRAKVIMNPVSGEGKARLLVEAVESQCRAHSDADILLTARPGHARELAAAAVEEGYDLVVAAGGDGTIHEVVNGLFDGERTQLPIGIIPLGSGNDLAYGLDIPLDVEAAVGRVFHGQVRLLDLGLIDDGRDRPEVFENNMGIGFDATIVIRTKKLDRLHGFPMYMAAVLQTIAFNFDAPNLDLRFDDEVVRQPSLFLSLGMGPRHGGGFLLTPDAQLDDGLIDSCLVNVVGRATMISMLLRVIKGTHVTSEHVTMRQNKQLEIRSSAPLPIHVDGEMLAYPADNIRQVTVTCLPGALRVVC